MEPGFIGHKPWTDADTANLSADGHRLCTAADALLDKLLAKDKGLQVKARDILEQGGDSVSRSRVPSFLKNAPEERAEVYKQLKQDPEVQGTLRDALMKTDGVDSP